MSSVSPLSMAVAQQQSSLSQALGMIVTKQNAQSEQAVAALLDTAAQNLEQLARAQSALARGGVDVLA